MSESTYHSPRIRDILLGVLLFLIILGAFCSLPDIVKRTGNMLLFVPAKLGVVTRVSAEEVRTIDLRTPSPVVLAFPQPGRYAVYTGDQQILMLTDTMLEEQTRPWLRVISSVGNSSANVSFVERGLRLYDTPLAEGRPIFTFVIRQPGGYKLAFPNRLAAISIVPDYTTGKERTIFAAYLLQILVAVLVFAALYYRRRPTPWAQARMRKQTQAQRRKETDAFWETMREKQKEDAGGKG